MTGKIIGAILAAIVLVGGGYYYFTMDSASAPMPLSATDNTPADSAGSVSPAPAAPVATDGGVDSFSAEIDAEISATNAAIGALDSDTDASVSSVQSTGNSSNLYDPNNL